MSTVVDPRENLARYEGRLPRYTSYPTAPHFHDGVDARVLADWLAATPEDARASIYIHVPFCRSLCWFCGCTTSVVRSETVLARYAAALEAEIAMAAASIGHRLGIAQVHFGGGTPTALPGPLLARIMEALARHFDLGSDAEIALELDPRSLPETAREDLAAIGITRASLGVQDFAPRVQDLIGRHQSAEQTERAAEVARAAGATSVNFDLVYGLPGQTLESLEATVETVLGLGPDRLALYGYAHVPWKQKRQQVIAGRALPGPTERFAQQDRAGALFEAAGYTKIGLDHFARQEDTMSRAAASGTLRRNFQGYTTDGADLLIGFGASSISQFSAGYAQNHRATKDYVAAIEAGRFATARGIEFNPEDRLRGAIIERLLCDLRVDAGHLAACHGMAVDTLDDAWPRLAPLEADGLMQRDGTVVTVAPEGRPFLRHIASAFDSRLHATDDRETAAPRHAAAI